MGLNRQHTFLMPALAFALALASPVAWAQVSAAYPATSSQGTLQTLGVPRPLSIGGAYGQSHTQLDCDGTSACQRRDRGYKLHVGYDLTLNAAMELGYLNFGEARDQLQQTVLVDGGLLGAVPVAATLDSRYGAKAWYAAVVLHAPLVAGFDASVRLGMAKVRTKVTNSITAAGVALPDAFASESHYKPYYGLALGYAVQPQLKLVAAADFTQAEFNHETHGVRLLTLGGQLNF